MVKDLHKEEEYLIEKLIELCAECEHQYRKAADALTDFELKTFFDMLSVQRGTFVAQLLQIQQEIVTSSRGDSSAYANPPFERSQSSRESAGKDEVGILSACDKSEKQILSVFHQAINSTTNYDLMEELAKKRVYVMQALEEIKRYRAVTVH